MLALAPFQTMMVMPIAVPPRSAYATHTLIATKACYQNTCLACIACGRVSCGRALRRMMGRAARCRWLDAIKPEIGQCERVHECINDANRIALVDEVIETLGQQCRLPTIGSRYEALHLSLRRIMRGIIEGFAFSHTQGQNEKWHDGRGHVRLGPMS